MASSRWLLIHTALLVALCASSQARRVDAVRAQYAEPDIPPTRRRLLSPFLLFVLGTAHGDTTSDEMLRMSLDIDRQFATVDADSDGHVSLKEFFAFVLGSIDGVPTLDRSVGFEEEAEMARKLNFLDQVFDKADLNANGALDTTEAEYLGYLANEELLLRERRSGGKASEREADEMSDQELFAEFDSNADGAVSWDEFVWIVTEGHAADLDMRSRSFLRETYAKGDLDNTGGLDLNELKFACYMIKRISTLGQNMEDRMLKVMFREWDVNGDGKIDEAELASIAEKVADRRTEDGWTALDLAQANFVPFDTDGNGSWDREEARQLAALILSITQHKSMAA